MAKKLHVTKTTGPIHFEDLDPKRFESLIRQLIYDFRDWQTIEATGESGNDEGFDVRAYEKVPVQNELETDDPSEMIASHPMEGNVWMIQGKREKAIGPSRIKEILKDVDETNPPYGYILAASANFSKDSFDLFRKELRKKGVMEFYLWGKPELEDMLYLPKNDRILFTFFGLSFVSKRKSRSTELRAVITVKNRLFSALGEHEGTFSESVLVRDLKDIHYPYESEYPDFKDKPKWREYTVFRYHPRGLLTHNRRWFAYIDRDKKEFDFTKEVDTVYRKMETDEEREKRFEGERKVKGVWDFLPRKQKGYFRVEGLIDYEDMVVVDAKGDMYYKMPHIFVDYQESEGPSPAWRYVFEIGTREFELSDEWKQIDFFPKKFAKKKIGKIHKKPIELDPASTEALKNFKDAPTSLFDIDDRYSKFNVRDVVTLAGTGYREGSENRQIQITSKLKITYKDYLASPSSHPWHVGRDVEQQIGKRPDESDLINVYEFQEYYGAS